MLYEYYMNIPHIIDPDAPFRVVMFQNARPAECRRIFFWSAFPDPSLFVLEMPANSVKDHLSIVICGHVESCTSTTTGRLLFELGGIPEREFEKLKATAPAADPGNKIYQIIEKKTKYGKFRTSRGLCDPPI